MQGTASLVEKTLCTCRKKFRVRIAIAQCGRGAPQGFAGRRVRRVPLDREKPAMSGSPGFFRRYRRHTTVAGRAEEMLGGRGGEEERALFWAG